MYLSLLHLLVAAVAAAPPSAQLNSAARSLVLRFTDSNTEPVQVHISSLLKVTMGLAELLSHPWRSRGSYMVSITPELIGCDRYYAFFVDENLSARFKRGKRVVKKIDRLKDDDSIELFLGKSRLLTINLTHRGTVRTYKQLVTNLKGERELSRSAVQVRSAEGEERGRRMNQRRSLSLKKSDDNTRESLLSLFMRIPRSDGSRTNSEDRQSTLSLESITETLDEDDFDDDSSNDTLNLINEMDDVSTPTSQSLNSFDESITASPERATPNDSLHDMIEQQISQLNPWVFAGPAIGVSAFSFMAIIIKFKRACDREKPNTRFL